MSLVEFYEIAEELIISLRYFNIKQKEEDMFVRLSTVGRIFDQTFLISYFLLFREEQQRNRTIMNNLIG